MDYVNRCIRSISFRDEHLQPDGPVRTGLKDISCVINDNQMSEFLLKLRDRQEMPINEDEYYLLGEIAERLIEISEQEDAIK